jgi:hypothetical protein
MFYWTLLKRYSNSTTVVEANEVLTALIAVDTVKSVSNNALTEILKDDLATILKHILTTLLAMVKQVLVVHQFFVKK